MESSKLFAVTDESASSDRWPATVVLGVTWHSDVLSPFLNLFLICQTFHWLE